MKFGTPSESEQPGETVGRMGKYQENHGKYRNIWHYSSHGSAECGADTPNMCLTTVKENVTCPTCRGWLPIIETKLRDLTPEEAQAAYDAAPAVPLSEQRIKEMVDYAVGRRTEMPTTTLAREIAARVWQDQEMRNCVMDVEAAEEIAAIIDRVRRNQADQNSYADLAASGGIVDAP